MAVDRPRSAGNRSNASTQLYDLRNTSVSIQSIVCQLKRRLFFDTSKTVGAAHCQFSSSLLCLLNIYWIHVTITCVAS